MTYQKASIGRRLGAFFYDLLIVFALLMLTTAVAYSLVYLFYGMELQSDVLVKDYRAVFQVVLLLTIYSFYIWFWTHGGQTLGMRAWRIQVLNAATEESSSAINHINFRQANIRLLVSLLSVLSGGCGLFWSLIDAKQMAWHDRASNSMVVFLP